ncbi:MAG: PilZ domain-containing protein [Candidatus Aureabacteria bacterium]|nr:PilZ domain-containing protein [Candidatus Auribacterota bacterium]
MSSLKALVAVFDEEIEYLRWSEGIMQEKTGIERRNAVRFPFKYPIRHHLEGVKILNHSLCDNLSLSGILFHSMIAYQKDQIVEILIDVSGEDRTITLKTIVVWTRPDPLFQKQYFVGGQFKNVSPEFISPLMEMAIRDLTLSIERTPSNIWLYRYRGDIRKAKGDEEGSRSDYDKAESLKRKPSRA